MRKRFFISCPRRRTILFALPKWATSLSLLFLAASVSAQTAATVKIDLDQAIQLALQHNHALLAVQSQIAQSRAQEIAAALRPNPVFTYDNLFIPVTPGGFNSTMLDTGSELDASAAFSWERGTSAWRGSRPPRTRRRSRARRCSTTGVRSLSTWPLRIRLFETRAGFPRHQPVCLRARGRQPAGLSRR